MPVPYIPTRDSLLDAWAANFSTLITASPSTYGLLSSDATTIAAAVATWHAAYIIATTPSARTPVTITAKDNARVSMLATVRPYAQRVANNAGVTAGQKITLGVNSRSNPPTPIAVPVTYPILAVDQALNLTHVIRARDQLASPSVKAKPFGAAVMHLHGQVTATGSPSVSLEMMPLVAVVTKVPTQVIYSPTNAGSTAVYAARWVTRTGLMGPFGPAVNFTIAGGGTLGLH
jgi:hypothetical protein